MVLSALPAQLSVPLVELEEYVILALILLPEVWLKIVIVLLDSSMQEQLFVQPALLFAKPVVQQLHVPHASLKITELLLMDSVFVLLDSIK
jgi:hypothetical protein